MGTPTQLHSIEGSAVHTGGSDRIPPDMSERLATLEGQISGLQHTQTMMLGGIGVVAGLVGIVAAFIIGFGIYTLQRIDQVGDRTDRVAERVNELPGKIVGELRDLTKTLADSITASKQTPPQVILVPTPPIIQQPTPPAR